MLPPRPLFVDLDGTLIQSDLLVESFLRLLFEQPASALMAPFWLARGKSVLKHEIARRVELDCSALPYNQAVLDWLKIERETGRQIVLATASHQKLAQGVADHVGLFDAVLASSETVNLSGTRKLDAIRQTVDGDFTYAGNDYVDLAIWDQAAGAVAVSAPRAVAETLRQRGKLEAEFPPAQNRWRALLKGLRPQQWMKNLLVFLPLLPIVMAVTPWMLGQVALAFAAFSLCASAVYVVNDLSDLAADRQHPRKRKRPFASGAASALHGLLLVPGLLAAAFGLAAAISQAFALVLLVYLIATTAYTFLLKRLALVDVLTLAGLYTIRVIGGGVAISVTPSFWILAFSIFIFFSLALAKRYTELLTMRSLNRKAVKGRGYEADDLSVVQVMGLASGLLAVLVMALYINSPEITDRYSQPQWLWGICPILLFWVSHLWLMAARGSLHDDPLVFALKNGASRIAIALAGLLVLAALI